MQVQEKKRTYSGFKLPPGKDSGRFFNGEREIPGRQKVARGSNVMVLTSCAGLNPRSKRASSLDDSPRLVMVNASSPNHSAFWLRSPHFVLVTSAKRELSILIWCRADTARYQCRKKIVKNDKNGFAFCILDVIKKIKQEDNVLKKIRMAVNTVMLGICAAAGGLGLVSAKPVLAAENVGEEMVVSDVDAVDAAGELSENSWGG